MYDVNLFILKEHMVNLKRFTRKLKNKKIKEVARSGSFPFLNLSGFI